jgi:hypothetical protein
MNCFNISFYGAFRTNVNQQTLINNSKAIISSYVKLLSTELHQITLPTAERTTKIINTAIRIQSNVPNDENG